MFRSRNCPTPGVRVGEGIRLLRRSESPRFPGRRRGLWFPILHHEEQRLIPSADRAALLSLRSFLFRGAFVAIGPAVGWWVDRAGQHRVLLVVGALVSALCLVAWAWLARVRSSAPAHAPIDAA